MGGNTGTLRPPQPRIVPGTKSSTRTVLHRSLIGIRALIGRSLAEVRLTRGIQNRERFLVAGFIDELTPEATVVGRHPTHHTHLCPSRMDWPSRLTVKSSRRCHPAS